MDTLIRDAWRMYHEAGEAVVKPSLPVLYFGDYERYKRSPVKIVTVGKNPSGNEFPASDRFQRFSDARELYPAILTGQGYPEYLGTLNSYFRTGTQLDWFDRSYEPVLRGAGWSFYGTGESVALHTDICSPLATWQPWRAVDREDKGLLATSGQALWWRLVNYLDPDVIIASIAEQHRTKIAPAPLQGWAEVYTVDRRNPYRVSATVLRLASGKQTVVVYARDAVMPFQLVSDAEKERIGAAILTHVRGETRPHPIATEQQGDRREEGSMAMQQVSKSAPLTKREFHERLRSWLREAKLKDEDRIDGGDRDYGGSAWIYVRDKGVTYRLHADAKARGVKEYLHLVDRHGDDLEWSVRENQGGKDNAIAYGPDNAQIRRFYLYKV